MVFGAENDLYIMHHYVQVGDANLPRFQFLLTYSTFILTYLFPIGPPPPAPYPQTAICNPVINPFASDLLPDGACLSFQASDTLANGTASACPNGQVCGQNMCEWILFRAVLVVSVLL